MDCGKMNKRITIQQSIVIEDKLGQQDVIWSEYCKTYAYVNGLSGSEYWSAQQVQAENTVVFSVRYTDKINSINTKDFRIVFNGANYDIKHIDNVQFANDIVKIKAVAKVE